MVRHESGTRGGVCASSCSHGLAQARYVRKSRKTRGKIIPQDEEKRRRLHGKIHDAMGLRSSLRSVQGRHTGARWWWDGKQQQQFGLFSRGKSNSRATMLTPAAPDPPSTHAPEIDWNRGRHFVPELPARLIVVQQEPGQIRDESHRIPIPANIWRKEAGGRYGERLVLQGWYIGRVGLRSTNREVSST